MVSLVSLSLVYAKDIVIRMENDGIIETRNGFDAPVGAKVDIVNGKIQ